MSECSSLNPYKNVPTCTFRLSIDINDATVLDTVIGTPGTSEGVSKAKKTIQRLLNEYSPVVAVQITPQTDIALMPGECPIPSKEMVVITADETSPMPNLEQMDKLLDAMNNRSTGAATASLEKPSEDGGESRMDGTYSAKRQDGVRGIIQIRCPECQKAYGTFLKQRQTEFQCRCGHAIDLTRPLARFKYTCPYCEVEQHGLTNMEDDTISIRCKCGQPVDLIWVPKIKEYRN